MLKTACLEVSALRLEQNPTIPLYLFSIQAGQISDVASIFRASRLENEEFSGYQRPEARRHVNDILEYLNSDHLLFPNALVLALSPQCRFSVHSGNHGTLSIPLNLSEKPAWIVDGQQRALALSRSRQTQLPVPVTAFVAEDLATMRDQFIRINNSKPLPRGLLTELLPMVSSQLSPVMQRKRAGSMLCTWLAERRDSPFYGQIKRSTSKSKTAVVSDTSVINAIQGNLFHPTGCLFTYQESSTGQVDYEACYAALSLYWRAVKEVFPEAWGLSSTKSRLTHGVGINALGRLMDRMLGAADLQAKDIYPGVVRELLRVRKVCAWTEGRWAGLGGIAWNELQNTPTHIRLLSDLLVRTYLGGKVR